MVDAKRLRARLEAASLSEVNAKYEYFKAVQARLPVKKQLELEAAWNKAQKAVSRARRALANVSVIDSVRTSYS